MKVLGVGISALEIFFISMLLLSGVSSRSSALEVHFLKDGGLPDVRIYVTKFSAIADVYVYFEDSWIATGGRSYIWHETNFMQAEKRLLRVKYSSSADLNVYFVEHEYLAHWCNENKRRYLEE